MTLADALAMVGQMVLATFRSVGLQDEQLLLTAVLTAVETMAVHLGCGPDEAFALAVDQAATLMLDPSPRSNS